MKFGSFEKGASGMVEEPAKSAESLSEKGERFRQETADFLNRELTPEDVAALRESIKRAREIRPAD